MRKKGEDYARGGLYGGANGEFVGLGVIGSNVAAKGVWYIMEDNVTT